MKKHTLITLGFILSILIVASCVKEEWVIDDNIEVPGLDPSFALPIGQTILNLGNLEQSLDDQNFIYNESNQLFAFAYNENLFHYKAQDLVLIPNQGLNYEYELSNTDVDNINTLAIGTTYTQYYSENLLLELDNSEELDSILLKMSHIDFNINSTINQNIQIQITLPTCTYLGQPYQSTHLLEFEGTLPIINDQTEDLSEYKLDLSNNGATVNTLPVELEITFTKTPEMVSPASNIDFDMDIVLEDYRSIWGYFGNYTEVLSTDTQNIDLFEHLEDGSIGFADPRINLTIYNSAGIDVEVDFNSVATAETGSIVIGGSDLTEVPIILGAAFPGDMTTTEHTIDNSGTSPTLTQLLESAPSQIVYSAEASTNPEGFSQNFVLDTSSIRCNAEIVLPLFLYADNFTFVDTIDVDLDEVFNGDDENFDEDDISKITFRLIADNGLPIDILAQVYLADSNSVIIDSLFVVDDYQNIFLSGLIDFSLPDTDPNYGKVYQSKRTITDIVIDNSDIDNIQENNIHQIIIKAVGLTSQAANGEYVKFYPSYNLGIKLSAKLDLDIDLTE